MADPKLQAPLTIRMHERDNVAIVANDGGLPAGTEFPSGLKLREHVPQSHKVSLVDLPEGAPVLRYNVVIGYALADIPAGSWVHERLLMPPRRDPSRTCRSPRSSPRRSRRSRATPSRATGTATARWARATSSPSRTTVQCVAGVVEYAVQRIKNELLPRYPTSTTWWRWSTPTAAASPSTRPTRCADPHAAQHQPQPEFRRRGDGGEPRLREAAAGAPAAAGNHPAPRVASRCPRNGDAVLTSSPAGRSARGLHVDD